MTVKRFEFSALKGLSPYLYRYRSRYLWGIFAGIVSSGMGVLTPYFLRHAIDGIQAQRPIWIWSVALLGASLLSAGFSWANRQLLVVGSRYIENDIRVDMFKHILWLDSYFYGKNRLGDIINRFNSDLNAVREMLASGVNMGSRLIITLIFAVASMYAVNVKLAFVLSLVFPVIFAIMRYVLTLIDKRYRESQEVFDQISTKAQENFSGIRVVKGFALEQKELLAFQSLNRDYIRTSLALTRVDGPVRALMGLMMGIATLVVVVMGGRMVVANQMTIGQFVQFTAYVGMLGWPIIGLGWTMTLFQRGATSQKRLDSFWEETPKIQDSPTAKSVELNGSIEMKNVSLELGGKKVLDDISLFIPEGSTIGITGRTGAGKTVLASLIPRLLEPDSGQILVGGEDISQIKLADLRKVIGMVPQEPFLFSQSLTENICFGLPRIDTEKAEWAAKLAGVHDDISNFPQGYDTSLGERGVTLSGGQRQRTALARALAREPKILILDDSMSAVDTETESRILKGLATVLGKQTTLLIAHRTSTLQYADTILVLEDGKIIENGTHAELIENNGLYAELDRIQRLEEDVNSEEAV